MLRAARSKRCARATVRAGPFRTRRRLGGPHSVHSHSRVQYIANPVAKEVESQNRQRQREAGECNHPWGITKDRAGICQDVAQARRRRHSTPFVPPLAKWLRCAPTGKFSAHLVADLLLVIVRRFLEEGGQEVDRNGKDHRGVVFRRDLGERLQEPQLQSHRLGGHLCGGRLDETPRRLVLALAMRDER